MPLFPTPQKCCLPKKPSIGGAWLDSRQIKYGFRSCIRSMARSYPAPTGRKRRSRAEKKASAMKAVPKPPPKTPSVTLPMEVSVQEQLMPLAPTNTPLWSAFCGHTNGVWQGRMAAFYAATGEAEPVSMVGKEAVYDLHTLVVEERPDDDLKLRRTLRSADLAKVRGANLEAAESRDDVARLEAAAVEQGDLKAGDWEVEQFSEEEEGLMYFDGGTFSRGPHNLLAAPIALPEVDNLPSQQAPELGVPEQSTAAGLEQSEEAEEGELLPASPDYGEDDTRRKTSVIEQCLAWGGEQRLRCVLTISVGVVDEEMDLEVLRLVLWKETWQGLVSDCAGDSCIVPGMQNPAESDAELSKGVRPSSRQLEGQWKAYDITAVPVEDDDPVTGERKRINLYFSQETHQQWRTKQHGVDTDGAAIWLPNKALVEIQMICPQSRGSTADSEEGMEEGSNGKGLLFTFSWAVNPNTVVGVHREYDADGELMECRNRSAVRGSWVGGSM